MSEFWHTVEIGDIVWWEDPDEGVSSGVYKVTRLAEDEPGEPRDPETIAVVVNEQGSVAEVYVAELKRPPSTHAWGIPRKNPSTFRVVYDGRRRGKDMVLILPMSQWGGRAYGLGRDHDYRLDTREPRVGQEIGVTVSDDSYRRLVAARNHRVRRRNGEKKQGSLFSVEEEGFALTHPKGTYERVHVPKETQDPLFEPEKPDREKMEELRERELAERAERKARRKKGKRKKNSGRMNNPDLERLKRRLMR